MSTITSTAGRRGSTWSLCRHCGERPRWLGSRGLCQPCYRVPAIRVRYPACPGCMRRGLGLTGRDHPLPAEPTAAVPGTPEQLAVLVQRAAVGTELHHPRDRQAGVLWPWRLASGRLLDELDWLGRD